MKVWTLLGILGVGLVGVAWGAPKVAWVPAEADLVMVGLDLDRGQKEGPITQQWLEAYEPLGVSAQRPEDSRLALEGVSPHLPAILKAAFGLSEDCKRTTVRSVVISLVLPKSLKVAADGSFPKGLTFYCVVENPTVDVKALDAAMQQLAAERAEEVSFHLSEGWREVRPVEPVKQAETFFGYHPIPEGLLVVLADDRAQATAFVEGKVPTMAPESTLAKQLVANPKAVTGEVRLIVPEFRRLMMKLTAEEPGAYDEMVKRVPLLALISSVQLKTFLSEEALNCVLAAQTQDEAAASVVGAFMSGWVSIGSTMILPPLLQTTNSPLIRLAQSITSETNGTEAALTLKVTPAQWKAVLQELTQPQTQSLLFEAIEE